MAEESVKYLVGDRYVDAWGHGDFVDAKQIAKIHKSSAAELASANAEEEPEDDEDEEGYASWTPTQLKAEVKNRELEVVDSKKATLIAALEADDEANPE